MKPAPFAYHAPATIDEAVALLEPGGEVRVLAGGQSLMQLMKLRRVKPRALVDINGVAGLDTIEERDGELVVGALVRQQTLLDDPVAARSWPLIGEALQLRRLSRDAPPRHGRRLARIRGRLGRAHRRRRRARRDDRGALAARRRARSPRATSSAARTRLRSRTTS